MVCFDVRSSEEHSVWRRLLLREDYIDEALVWGRLLFEALVEAAVSGRRPQSRVSRAQSIITKHPHIRVQPFRGTKNDNRFQRGRTLTGGHLRVRRREQGFQSDQGGRGVSRNVPRNFLPRNEKVAEGKRRGIFRSIIATKLYKTLQNGTRAPTSVK